MFIYIVEKNLFIYIHNNYMYSQLIFISFAVISSRFSQKLDIGTEILVLLLMPNTICSSLSTSLNMYNFFG